MSGAADFQAGDVVVAFRGVAADAVAALVAEMREHGEVAGSLALDDDAAAVLGVIVKRARSRAANAEVRARLQAAHEKNRVERLLPRGRRK